MAIYDINGNELSACYDVNGNALTNAYDVSGNSIWTAEDTFAEKTYHYTLPEALTYAYGKMMAQYSEDTSAFILFTDTHDGLAESRANFLDYVGSYVDWSKVWMIDLGDTVNYQTPEEVEEQANSTYATITAKMTAAGIPDNRKMATWGNHDMAVKDTSDNTSYALLDHSWLLSGYFENPYATRYYDNDYVRIDAEHGIKFVSIGGWDYTEGAGYNDYRINSEHMERIIEMLSVVDNYDIVLLSHCSPYSAYVNMHQWSNDLDGEMTTTESGGINASSRLGGDCVIDSLLAGRSSHTTGTVTDSGGTEHSFDFTGCNGRILCGLFGHFHLDQYWYAGNGGMLEYEFDGNLYSPYPCYMGLIDMAAEKLKLWKINTNGTVFSYEMPFRDAE